jgi:hypothetical protein
MLSLIKVLFLSLLLISCDDTIGKIKAVGKKGTISCFSGGKLVLKMRSAGKILSESGSGYYFTNDNGNTVEVDMPCVIIYTDEEIYIESTK